MDFLGIRSDDMKGTFNKIMMVALMTTIIALQAGTSSAYTKIYETASPIEAYADGVTHQNVKIFTNEGWINMNILRVDLEKNIEMTVLTDTVLSTRDTLTNLVKKNNTDNTIIAAINSDFFDTSNSTTMGNLVRDNQLLTTAVGYDEFASFNIGLNGMPFVGYINSPKNTFTNGTTTKAISYINKPYLMYNRTIYFDSNFAKKSYGKTFGVDILEMLVIDNVVTEIRRAGEPFSIPANGYVLASVGTDIADVTKNFKVGDTISIKYDANFKYMDLSIGGGAQLVADGKVISPFSQNITGLHPRTGLGISKDRKELILVTIDGRTASYRGVSQTELANLLIGLGAYEAINLDGGGSTQMVAKSPWTTNIATMNFPSDQSERRMYTALAIEKVLTNTPVLRATKINLASPQILLGSQMNISLQGSDSNFNAMAIPAKDVVWTVTGVTGTFNGNQFSPTSLGKGTITATYGGISSTQDIVVKNNGVKLIASLTSIKVDEGQEKAISFSVLTEEGKTIPISSSVVKAVVPTTLGTFNTERSVFVASNQAGQGYIECAFDGLKTFIPVGVGLDKQLFYDFEKPTATFSGYPATVTGSYAETTVGAKTGKSAVLNYDFSKSTDSRAAYIIFNAPATLPKDTQGIGVWVFGDKGNNHWLRAKVVDAAGVSTNISFAKEINWTGWKYVTAELPVGGTAPYILERIYLVETDATKLDSGYILLDQVEAVTSKTMSVSVPAEVNRIKKALDYKLPAELVGKSSKLMSFAYYDTLTKTVDSFMKSNAFDWTINSRKFSQTERSDATLIKFNNQNGTIRKNDYSQWVKFLSFVKNTTSSKPIVLMMSDAYVFNDALEHELFLEQLQILNDKNIDVAVIFTTANKTFNVGKVNGATVIKVPKSGEAMLYLNLGILDNKIYFEAK